MTSTAPTFIVHIFLCKYRINLAFKIIQIWIIKVASNEHKQRANSLNKQSGFGGSHSIRLLYAAACAIIFLHILHHVVKGKNKVSIILLLLLKNIFILLFFIFSVSTVSSRFTARHMQLEWYFKYLKLSADIFLPCNSFQPTYWRLYTVEHGAQKTSPW